MGERFHRYEGGVWKWEEDSFNEKDVDDVFIDISPEDERSPETGFVTVRLKDGTTYDLDGNPYEIDGGFDEHSLYEDLALWRSCLLGTDDYEKFMHAPKKSAIKPIETFYHGYRFRSRLEARWAVFFDACNIEWEYEPEGFDLGDGMWYLPDFYLHGVHGRAGKDLWVEVKGVMTSDDEEKIVKFSGFHDGCFSFEISNPIYVVGNFPKSTTFIDYINDLDKYHDGMEAPFYNFKLIDGDYFGAIPCITSDGFEICGDDSNYLIDVDERKTMNALNAARQARFEHGEHGFNKN